MAAHLVVDDVERPVVADTDRHHVERVLRLRPGEAVTVTDGRGSVRACRLGAGLALEPDGDVAAATRPAPPVTIGFAMLKGDRPAWVVQKLTELGVDRIVPFVTARTVVRGAANVDRLRRVAREALMQSHGAWLPEVADVVPFETVAGAVAVPGAADAPSLAWAAVLVGPEGGFTNEELDGRQQVSLGPNVLRAETAAVVAATLLTSLRARIVAECPPI